MPRTLLAALIALALTSAATAGKITSDPNTPGRATAAPASKPDPRLSQKITCKARLKPMTAILQDLAEQTGVKLICGKSASDWIVREDVATIYAAGVPLGNLMDSLARVMRFAWIKSGTEPDWSYRLVEDSKAVREAKDRDARRQNEARKKRQQTLDLIMGLGAFSESRHGYLRDENPQLYSLVKAGVTEPLAEWLRMVPEVRQSWVSGPSLSLQLSNMPPAAHQAYINAISAYGRYLADAYPEDADYVKQINSSFREHPEQFEVNLYTSSRSPYGLLRLPYGSILLGPPEGRSLLAGKARLRAQEQKRPFGQVYAEFRPQFEAFDKLDQKSGVWNNTMEDLLIPADDPYLHDKLKTKIDSDAISGVVFQLAEATELAVVTDNFRGKTRLRADDKREVGETISDVAQLKQMNWQRRGDTIEMWNRNWYETRRNRVCLAWLDTLRKRITQNETLDVDDLADVAALTDEQLYTNFSPDRLLRQACSVVWERRDYLKLYGSLTRDQRALLVSSAGLGFDSLSDSQAAAAVKLAGNLKVPAPQGVDIRTLGLRLTAARAMDGKAITYTMRASSPLGPLPGSYVFRTPVCTLPVAPPAPPAPAD